VTEAKAYKNVGQEGNSKVTFHALGNAKEYEGRNPHIPKGTPTLGVEVLVDSRIFKERLQGPNSLDWGIPYIIRKFLKRRYLKWVRMTHLDIWNIGYGQKKGRESNWWFDSRPLKVRNRLDFLACRWHVTYRSKALNEGYNFTLDFISIRGLQIKLWAPKVTGVPSLKISRPPLGKVPGQKTIWMWPPWRGT
jgi:hypothetical protein